MNKLSKREKGMIIMLGIVFACALLFMLVAKPIIDTVVANKSEIATLEEQVSEARIALERRPVIEKQLNDAIEFVNQNGKNFYNKMMLWDAERHITKVLYDNKIEYHAISMTDPKPFVNLTDDVAKTPVDPNIPVDSTGITEFEITVECHTTIAKFSNVLDAFYKLEKKVTISNWDYQLDEKTPEIKAVVTFKMYSLD